MVPVMNWKSSTFSFSVNHLPHSSEHWTSQHRCNSMDSCSDPIGRPSSFHALKQTEGALTESSAISSSSNWSHDCHSDRVDGSVPLRQRGVVALLMSPMTSWYWNLYFSGAERTGLRLGS